jgi:hypothetical protein
MVFRRPRWVRRNPRFAYATAAREAKKISIGIALCSRQVTAIGRLPSWVT